MLEAMNENPPCTFVRSGSAQPRDAGRRAIDAAWFADESERMAQLCARADLSDEAASAVREHAADWVVRVRQMRGELSPLDSFMQEYDLSSEEGVLLMCLAEALLRIPDEATAEKLIAEKLSSADWEAHVGQSDSLFVNASTWGLMLTGRLVRLSPDVTGNIRSALGRLIGRSSEPVIRVAIRQAMRMMGHQFVLGRTITEALDQSLGRGQRRFLHSFDMLGEAALTAEDAARHLRAYQQAVDAIARRYSETQSAPVQQRPGISVKLSALHPRYVPGQQERVMAELGPVLLALVEYARSKNIGVTVDAEEADRLDLSLDLVGHVLATGCLAGWDGFGVAVQAFQKRAPEVIDWLEMQARTHGLRLAVRLVKGAYWDTEIKRSQEGGHPDYPVYTRKANTDVSYLACGRRLLAARDVFYPQFATHNAQTIAQIHAYAGDLKGYEFQRLHGMGDALHQVVLDDLGTPCRVYAPVGSHEDLLPYLVRRLLENGANTSFVNRIFDEQVAPQELVQDPVAVVALQETARHPGLPLPRDLFGSARVNSDGLVLAHEPSLEQLSRALAAQPSQYDVQSVLAPGLRTRPTQARPLTDPADRRRLRGSWHPLAIEDVPAVVAAAVKAHQQWSRVHVQQRSHVLELTAEALRLRRPELIALLVREAGKTLPDAVSEVREAEDFLRYYAQRARVMMNAPLVMPGPTGEYNALHWHGKGVFACIAPWNFPLAIFLGQVAAALVTGNSVIAKPAEQTPSIAWVVVGMLHKAGVPTDVLQLVLGEGDLGAALCADLRVGGVAFTGSVEVARRINRQLALRDGPIATLIAETGGQNVMIADSSALPEQLVGDCLQSAFGSAGQRCSALRVLYVQNEIADRVSRMLSGAMEQLEVGDPGLLRTDIGPVIDDDARDALLAHLGRLRALSAPLIGQASLSAACESGTFVAPVAVGIDGIQVLEREHFGPVLHLVRYGASRFEAVLEAINQTGYGLTVGVHSRVERTWRAVQQGVHAGHYFVNRGMTGAVVGVQPFGGEGLSGTGPKAGGPNYLQRFMNERTLTINTAAVGGNARLLAQGS